MQWQDEDRQDAWWVYTAEHKQIGQEKLPNTSSRVGSQLYKNNNNKNKRNNNNCYYHPIAPTKAATMPSASPSPPLLPRPLPAPV